MNSKRYRAAVASTLLIVVVCAPGQAQNCDAIIQHGLRNIEVSQSEDASFSVLYNKHCRQDLSKMADKQVHDASVGIFGIGKAAYEGSTEVMRESLAQFCRENHQRASSSTKGYSESRQIYDAAVRAWAQCNELLGSRDSMQVDVVSLHSDLVQLGLSYSGEAAGGVPFYRVRARGFSCEVDARTPDGEVRTYQSKELTKLEQPIRIGPLRTNVVCEREPALVKTSPEDGLEYSVQPAGYISISTAGRPFQLDFVEEWNPPLLRARAVTLEGRIGALERWSSQLVEVPVGSILAWQPFSEDADGTRVPRELPPGWQICDGSNGTPDLRGRFLQGAARDDAGQMGGASAQAIQAREIKSYTTGGWNERIKFNGDKMTNIHEASGWNVGSGIESKGQIPAVEVPTIPPFWSVVYIVKVR